MENYYETILRELASELVADSQGDVGEFDENTWMAISVAFFGFVSGDLVRDKLSDAQKAAILARFELLSILKDQVEEMLKDALNVKTDNQLWESLRFSGTFEGCLKAKELRERKGE